MSPTHDRALEETVVDSCEESFGLVPATPPNWSRRFFSGELNGASEFSATVALDDSRRIRSGDRGVFGVVWVRVEVKVCCCMRSTAVLVGPEHPHKAEQAGNGQESSLRNEKEKLDCTQRFTLFSHATEAGGQILCTAHTVQRLEGEGGCAKAQHSRGGDEEYEANRRTCGGGEREGGGGGGGCTHPTNF